MERDCIGSRFQRIVPRPTDELPPKEAAITDAHALHRFTLHFRDAAMEARFRASEDGESVRLIRIGMLAAIPLLALMTVLIDIAPARLRGPLEFWPVALGGSLIMLAGVGVTSLRAVQDRAQWAVVILCLLFTGAVGSLMRHVPVEFATQRGFMLLMLHLFSIHSLLRLRVVPAAVASWASIAMYGVLVHASGVISQQALARHLFWLVIVNFWGSWISRSLDRTTRSEFVARSALDAERARSEALLLNILPASIAAQLKDSHEPIAEHREEVTVLFADIVGFTPLAAKKRPSEIVAMLDRVFTAFDALAREHGLEKIKTIGDAYMAVAGLPDARHDHALRAARMALAMVTVVESVAAETGELLQLRVGLHSGPVVAGVIGRSKFAYDLWGDTVNTASRMESSGLPQRVHCTPETADQVRGVVGLEARGPIDVKGKGLMETFLLRAA